MERIELLGVPVDPVSVESAVPQILSLLRAPEQSHIMTPNSEMLVMASRDEDFRTILRATRLNLPDSAGLLWAAKWTGQVLPERVTGVDTVYRLCTELTEDAPLFLLGARDGVAERAAEILQKQNPRLRIAGTYSGTPRTEDDANIRERITASGARVLLVAYGAPAQDKWIARNLSALPEVRIAIGIGGTFDFVSGVRKRAPEWMRSLSLEWLYRLIQEPRRFGRIVNAVLVFPLFILFYGKKAPRL